MYNAKNMCMQNINDFLARSRAYGPVLSVRLSGGTITPLKLQHIHLKLSTLLFEAKSGAKFEDGQNRTKKFHVVGTSSKPKLGLWGKKIILSE
jgi:hypothetical protein